MASNFGEFKHVICNDETGLLYSNNEEWYNALKKLIIDEKLQLTIANNAYKVCKEHYISLRTGNRLSNHLNSISNKHIGFILPLLEISWDIRVSLMHAISLQDEGWDVYLLVPEDIQTNAYLYEFKVHKINIIIMRKNKYYCTI